MKKIQRIYVDFDDVLCETAKLLMRVAKREFGTEVDFESIGSFDIGVSFGLTPKQVEHTMDILHDPIVIAAIEPVEGAAGVLGRWANTGFKIDVVTGRPPATAEASRTWLQCHDIPYSSLVFVDKYDREHPDTPYATAITLDELRQADYLLAIDDSPQMIRFLAQRTDMHVLLFDRPWNAGIPMPDSHAARVLERCCGWSEVAERFALESV